MTVKLVHGIVRKSEALHYARRPRRAMPAFAAMTTAGTVQSTNCNIPLRWELRTKMLWQVHYGANQRLSTDA